jgi:phosphohistidine phosphatase
VDLLLIRHADAGDAAQFASSGRSDDERPLSEDGRRKMRQGARGLRTIVPAIDVLAASPLVRARQTAEIVAAAYHDLKIETVPALAPEQPPDALAAWLARRDGTVAVVGHEPHLSRTIGWLVAGAPRSLIELKKGAACLLALDSAGPGTATLRWALTPGQLRALGD